MIHSNRRQFLISASLATAGALIAPPRRAYAVTSKAADGADVKCRLDTDWQFRTGPTDGIWQVWRSEENDQWADVALPHCFNAYDACDPLAAGKSDGNTLTVHATLHDDKGVLCLDARNAIRFSVAGDSKLIDNLGTARGSRELQMSNGRAEIAITLHGASTVAVNSQGVAPAFLQVPPATVS